MRNPTVLTLLLCFVAAFPAAARAAEDGAVRAAPPAPIERLDEHVEAVRQRFQVPGIAVAVVKATGSGAKATENGSIASQSGSRLSGRRALQPDAVEQIHAADWTPEMAVPARRHDPT